MNTHETATTTDPSLDITNVDLSSLEVNFDNTEIAFSNKSNGKLRKQYFLFAVMNNPTLVSIGTKLVKWGFSWHLPIKGLIKHTIFEQFCGGENIDDCEKTIQQLARQNVGTILDYSVEGAENEENFDHTVEEILATIQKSATSKHIPFCVFKVTGLATVDLLTKIQSKSPLSPAEEEAFTRVKKRVDTICRCAYEKKVRIFIDAEETWIQEVI
ncbi:MAG: proline dehydrogenase family protein, partial [Flammeovirgaceae bacterium]|nr:proline dehydrogenase family protein [Flammeovirgaceae bacterium]